jgi:ABC-type lipoprotein export system ATPase subunit
MSDPNNHYDGPVIQTEDLWRTYRAGTHQEVHALQGVNLEIAVGSYFALKGRSGSGKTTLLNSIGGLDRPTKGSVKVFGIELKNLKDRQLTKFYRENVGFIFQAFGLSPIYTALENVEIVMQIAGKGRKERRERAQFCLERVGLSKWMNHRIYEISGGQQQRIAIARALANEPRLILADEPTGKLDTATAREIFLLFREIVVEDNVTVLMAAHDPLVDEYADKVLQLQDGQILPEEGEVQVDSATAAEVLMPE